MRVNLLFMSPIILKYLPFCAFLLPVSLQCDKRLQASSLNPFLLPPISSFISQTSYKSLLSAQFLLLHFVFLPQEVVYTGPFLWESCDCLTMCLWHFSIFYSGACLCVCLTCYMFGSSVWRATIRVCVYFCTFCTSVWPQTERGVCSVYIKKRKKEERKWNSMLNELWSMYRYLLCVVPSAWVNEIHVRMVQK